MDHGLLAIVARGAGPEQGIADPAFDQIHRSRDDGLSAQLHDANLDEMEQHRFGQQFGDGVQGGPGHQMDIAVGMVGSFACPPGFDLSGPKLDFRADPHIADQNPYPAAGDPGGQAFGDQDGGNGLRSRLRSGALAGQRRGPRCGARVSFPVAAPIASSPSPGPGG